MLNACNQLSLMEIEMCEISWLKIETSIFFRRESEKYKSKQYAQKKW